MCNNTQLSFYF